MANSTGNKNPPANTTTGAGKGRPRKAPTPIIPTNVDGNAENGAGMKRKKLEGTNTANKKSKKHVQDITNNYLNNKNEVEDIEAQMAEMQKRLEEARARQAPRTPEQISTTVQVPAAPKKTAPVAPTPIQLGSSPIHSVQQPTPANKSSPVWPPIRGHNRVARNEGTDPTAYRAGALAAGAIKEEIEPIARPRGEAGDGKRGFKLQEAVGLKDDDVTYNKLLSATRKAGESVRTDLSVMYKNQDPAKIYLVCSKVSQEVPYFNIKRFLAHWPIKEAYKQWIKNQRKQQNIKVRNGRARSLFVDSAVHVSDEEDEDVSYTGDAGTEAD